MSPVRNAAGLATLAACVCAIGDRMRVYDRSAAPQAPRGKSARLGRARRLADRTHGRRRRRSRNRQRARDVVRDRRILGHGRGAAGRLLHPAHLAGERVPADRRQSGRALRAWPSSCRERRRNAGSPIPSIRRRRSRNRRNCSPSSSSASAIWASRRRPITLGRLRSTIGSPAKALSRSRRRTTCSRSRVTRSKIGVARRRLPPLPPSPRRRASAWSPACARGRRRLRPSCRGCSRPGACRSPAASQRTRRSPPSRAPRPATPA